MDVALLTDEFIISTCYRRWGLSPKRTSRRQFNSPCPRCGGDDRFSISSEYGGYWCRQCDLKGFLDDDNKKVKRDPLLIQKHIEEIARKKQEQEGKDRAWATGFNVGNSWRYWHDQMKPHHRKWWWTQGISDFWVDYYELGFIPEKEIYHKEERYIVPAYSIPVRDPETWQIVDMHYRIANPPVGVQKYRYQDGVTAKSFYARKGNTDTAFVLEGAKKAIVLNAFLNEEYQVVGMPGCMPHISVIEKLKVFRNIWLILDPGTENAVKRFKEIIPRTRVVTVPDKIDDIIIQGLTRVCLDSLLEQAR